MSNKFYIERTAQSLGLNASAMKPETPENIKISSSCVSELDIQANYLTESLSSLAQNIDLLNSKLDPILRACSVANLTEDDVQEATSSLGNFIHSAAKDVNKLNNKVSQILQSLAV